MSECIHRNFQFLKNLNSCSGYKRKKILKTCTKDNINALTEVAHNVLKGNVTIDSEDKKAIKRHRDKVRNLAKKRVSFKKKRQQLTQKGGFLPRLLRPTLKFLAAVGASAVANSIF